MIPRFDVNTDSFEADIRRLSRLNGKGLAENLKGFARTTIKNTQGTGVMDITPPGSQGRVGMDAKRQGERAIDRDIARHFVPVKSTGQGPRGESPKQYHRAMFQFKKLGKPLRRNRKQPYFVDANQLRALVRELKSHVGRLASGWLSAAQQLGVRAPAWISRHGTGRGSIVMHLNSPRYTIDMTCNVPANVDMSEMERRLNYAQLFTRARVKRAIEGTIEANARSVGMTVS
jgi:hypothetical protein